VGINAPDKPIARARRISPIASSMSSVLIIATPLSRSGAARQNSATKSL